MPPLAESVAEKGRVAVQGPSAVDVVAGLCPGDSCMRIRALGNYRGTTATIAGHAAAVSRTGYTGELGYEIYCPWEKCKEIWKTILNNATVKPTGLGVRDVLRVEMCYSLYGHELGETISPLEAGLDKFIDGKKDFIGRQALSAPPSGRAIGYLASASRNGRPSCSPRA